MKEIHDHQVDGETFKISNINTTKLQKLMKIYNIMIMIEDIQFDYIPVVGISPEKFLWSDHSEEWHSTLYTNYVKDNFIGFNFLTNHDIINVSNKKTYLNIHSLCGTADLLICKKTNNIYKKSTIDLVIEVKKVI